MQVCHFILYKSSEGVWAGGSGGESGRWGGGGGKGLVLRPVLRFVSSRWDTEKAEIKVEAAVENPDLEKDDHCEAWSG